jgi:Na+/proline symporter
MSLISWSWLFLVLYVGGMLVLGYVASKRVKDADGYATARGSYGPIFLAMAFAATTASGATFLGGPGLSYQYGTAVIWTALYPCGVYLGILICMKLVATAGHRFADRSIPEFLGDRYMSDGIRVLVAIFSLVLFFYLAGQLVSGLVMFEIMLGLSPEWALGITTVVLLMYVTMGGAHADILTDGVQGFIMLILAIVIIYLFLSGTGVEGGLSGVLDNLEKQDPNLVGWLNTSTPLYHSWWSMFAWTVALLPLGLLPHIGNKLWALEHDRDRLRFVKFAFVAGMLMACMGFGGLLARAVLGDALLADGMSPNQALPRLFIELFPTWLAALIGVGVLAAIMSTADGLVVSSSQVIANDLYRRTYVPRRHPDMPDEEVDRRVLLISRFSTIGVLLICAALAWMLVDKNIALIIMIGTGGMMAAFAGPLVMGAVWHGVTKAGAYAGLVSGMASFLILHGGVLNADWFAGTPLFVIVEWLVGESPNPYSCAGLGEIVSIVVTYVVSKLTRPLPEAHLEDLFGKSTA